MTYVLCHIIKTVWCLFLFVVYVTGAKLSVRPSKIVAGLEAEKTNDFLQALAAAVDKKVGSMLFS